MTKSRTMIALHRGLLVAWTLMLPLSFVLRESIFWLVFMSHYTIIVGHWGGWDASRAEKTAAEQGDQE